MSYNKLLVCLAERSGSTGVIHLVHNDSDLEWAIKEGLAAPYMLVMSLNMLTPEVMRVIRNNPEKISGTLVNGDGTSMKFLGSKTDSLQQVCSFTKT